jgi:hypothetical protein
MPQTPRFKELLQAADDRDRSLPRQGPVITDEDRRRPLPAPSPAPEPERVGFGTRFLDRAQETLGNVGNFVEDLTNDPLGTFERAGIYALGADRGDSPTAQYGQQRYTELRERARSQRTGVGDAILRDPLERNQLPSSFGGKAGNLIGNVLTAPVNVTPENVVENAVLGYGGGKVLEGAGMLAKPLIKRGLARIGRLRAPVASEAGSVVSPLANENGATRLQSPGMNGSRNTLNSITPEAQTAARGVSPSVTGPLSTQRAQAKYSAPQLPSGRPVGPRLYDPLESSPDAFYESPAPSAGMGITAETGATRPRTATRAQQPITFEAGMNAPGAGADLNIGGPGGPKPPGGASGGSSGGPPPLRPPGPGARARLERAKEIGTMVVNEVAAVPRAIKASLDFSGPLRQGAFFVFSPRRAALSGKAFLRQFPAFVSGKAYGRYVDDIANRAAETEAEQYGLYLATKPGRTLGQTEEAFASRLIGKAPGIKQSERAYTTFLDTIRIEAFEKFKNAIDRAGLSAVEAGRELNAYAKQINYMTGRGTFGKRYENSEVAKSILNTALFSPRFLASRFNVLSAVTAPPRARKEALKDIIAAATVLTSTLTLYKLSGGDVEADPRSQDFGKIKLLDGKTRYDLGAGYLQDIRVVANTIDDLATEKHKASAVLKTVGRFGRNKLAPIPGVGINALEGENAVREPFSAGQAARDLLAPLTPLELYQGYQREGGMGVLKASPSIFGVGVQNYGKKLPPPGSTRPRRATRGR